MPDKTCRHAPHSLCCLDEIKGRKCPAHLNGQKCVGRDGAFGANKVEAMKQFVLHPERRKQTTSGQVPLERRRGYRYAATNQACQSVSA